MVKHKLQYAHSGTPQMYLPRVFVSTLGWIRGDKIEIELVGNTLVLEKVKD